MAKTLVTHGGRCATLQPQRHSVQEHTINVARLYYHQIVAQVREAGSQYLLLWTLEQYSSLLLHICAAAVFGLMHSLSADLRHTRLALVPPPPTPTPDHHHRHQAIITNHLGDFHHHHHHRQSPRWFSWWCLSVVLSTPHNGKEEWLCAVINATLFSRNLICKLRNLSPWPWQRWKVVLGLEFTIHRDARDNADSVQLDWIQRSQSVALWWSHRLRNPSRPAMGLQCRLYISPFEAMRATSKYYRLTFMSLRPWTWL